MTAHASHLVGPLLRYAREREVAIDLARYGLHRDALDRDESPIADAALGKLFDDVAIALDEPSLGLILPGRLKFERYAIPELAARASATLRQALQEFTRYSSLLHPTVQHTFEERDGSARFSQRTLGHPRGLSRHLNEFALAAPIHFSRETSGTAPRVLEVSFANARPRGLDALRAFFQTDVLRFGALANTLVLDSASLDRPQLTADARLLTTVAAFGQRSLAERPVDGESVRARVSARLRAQLERGERIRPVARELHMSVRTLQRRLEEEGTTFAALLDEVRRELSCELVRSADLSLVQVANKLGFAEFATFSRAFKRWTGKAPGAYRNQSTSPSAESPP